MIFKLMIRIIIYRNIKNLRILIEARKKIVSHRKRMKTMKLLNLINKA